MKYNVQIVYTILCMSLFSCASAQNAAQTATKTDSMADRMVAYQLNNGGWSKHYKDGSKVDYNLPLTDEVLTKVKEITPLMATIDNKATTLEISALVKAYKETANPTYLVAAEKGIDYLLKAQYANGGWPQYYPDKSSYRAEITYNDDAIVNVLNIMLGIATRTDDFEVVNAAYVSKAEDAVKRGIDCILNTQIIQNGKPSIWAAQYDQNTLKPAKARNFEPASLSTSESVGIIRFLMKIKNLSPEIKTAITNGIKWFEASKITGYKFEKMANGDRGLIADPTAVIWARFYDFDTNKPIFGDRDNSIKSNVADISFERRNGYAWYGNWGLSLLTKDYPKWLKANP